MDSAKEALKLFVRSLPVGCFFTIISFGSRFSNLEYEEKSSIQYTEQAKQYVLTQIEGFRADHGGTNIVTPLSQA